MPFKLRILSTANRVMQRLGFLKPLCAMVVHSDTSNLSAMGSQLIASVSRRVRREPPYSDELRDYVKRRLTDRVYADLRKSVLKTPPEAASFELQDLYLCDPRLISNTGKLVEKDWRFYPYLGTALDLIRPGTYSAMTRAVAFVKLTGEKQIAAFDKFDAANNPLLLNSEQAALLLYCFIDNDAEVIRPLFARILEIASPNFDERTAGDELPAILRKTINGAQRFALTHEDRERLGVLSKVADNVAAWKGRPYTGSGAREESIRPRLEPYCDLGLFVKPERHRFTYTPTPALVALLSGWSGPERTDEFLREQFFSTLTAMHSLQAEPASLQVAREALRAAGDLLQSSLGYSPITDLALLAGIQLLFRQQRLLEIHQADSILTDWQREAPNAVRFTVDRMGNRAFVKFLASSPAPSANAGS